MMEAFRNGTHNVLVATQVGGRGRGGRGEEGCKTGTNGGRLRPFCFAGPQLGWCWESESVVQGGKRSRWES